MLLNINNDYRITSDRYNVSVEARRVVEEGDNKGKEYWTPVGYYPNLERALKGMVNDGIQTKDLQGVAAIMTQQAEMFKEIMRAIEAAGKALERP